MVTTKCVIMACQPYCANDWFKDRKEGKNKTFGSYKSNTSGTDIMLCLVNFPKSLEAVKR